jgi:hypothetical protein
LERDLAAGEELSDSDRHLDLSFAGAYDWALSQLRANGKPSVLAFRIEEYLDGKPGRARAWCFDRTGAFYSGSQLPSGFKGKRLAASWAWKPGVVVAIHREGYLIFGVIVSDVQREEPAGPVYTVRLPIVDWDGRVVEVERGASEFLPYPAEAVGTDVTGALAELVIDETTHARLMDQLRFVAHDPRPVAYGESLLAQPIENSVGFVFYALDRISRRADRWVTTTLGYFSDQDVALATLREHATRPGVDGEISLSYVITRLGVGGEEAYMNQCWLGSGIYDAFGNLRGWNAQACDNLRTDGKRESSFHVGDIIAMRDERNFRPGVVVKLPDTHRDADHARGNTYGCGAYAINGVHRNSRSLQSMDSSPEEYLEVFTGEITEAVRRQLAAKLLSKEERRRLARELILAPSAEAPPAAQFFERKPKAAAATMAPHQASAQRFIDRFLAGSVGTDAFDEAVSAWHDAPTDMAVSEYLGISEGLYAALTMCPEIVELARDTMRGYEADKMTLRELEYRVLEELARLDRLRESWWRME